MKVDFILRNLQILSKSLDKLNIPLLLVQTPRFAAVPTKLLDIARKTKCSALYYNLEYEVNEQHRDEQVRKLFEKAGHPVHVFVDQTLLDVSL